MRNILNSEAIANVIKEMHGPAHERQPRQGGGGLGSFIPPKNVLWWGGRHCIIPKNLGCILPKLCVCGLTYPSIPLKL